MTAAAYAERLDAARGGPAAAIADDAVPALDAMTRMQTLRGIVRLSGFVIATLLMIPVQWTLVKLRAPARRTFPARFHRMLCRILGIRVTVKGKLAEGHGLLIAANHTSWLDIPVMSTVGPVSFVAKAQVDKWPFFGLLGRLQETVYVERERKAKTAEQRDAISARVAAGDNIVLFPEGTSNDGNRVLPFKSALMSVAEGQIHGPDGRIRDILVQPMTVAYTKLHGMPMGREYRPFFAWYGDMDLVPHLWDAMRLGPLDVEITLHEPLTLAEAGGRKALAAACEKTIGETLALALAGRG